MQTGHLALADSYGLCVADAAHLATAVVAVSGRGRGPDRFATNNRNDFPRAITGIGIVYPDGLPEP